MDQLGVSAEESKVPQVFQTLPNRHVVEESFWIEAWKILAKYFQMSQRGFGVRDSPDKSPALFRKPVDFFDPTGQSGHDRIVDLSVHPGEVAVGQLVDHIAEVNILRGVAAGIDGKRSTRPEVRTEYALLEQAPNSTVAAGGFRYRSPRRRPSRTAAFQKNGSERERAQLNR